MDDLTQEFLAESREGLDRMELRLTELERRPGSQDLVAEIFRVVHTIKGATGFLGFSRLERLAHACEELLCALRDGHSDVSAQAVTVLLDALDRMRSVLQLIERSGGEGVRAHDEDDDLLQRLEGLLLLGRTSTLVPQQHKADSPAEQQAAHALQLSPALGAEKTLRVDVEALNRMMNLVGELVLTRNQILRSSPGTGDFAELARRLDGVTAELRTSVMQARMQPVGNLFGKLTRMARELARTCGRQVRVEFTGQDTALDKSLLEAVRDPLTHILRNAVDHGIEPPDQRVQAGKAAEGRVQVRAFQRDGSVVLEIEDDGAGIRTERVLTRAVERSILTPAQAEGITRHEALQLIFLPGFTTSETVSIVSGRGVGMDIVRASVEKVGGRVEVESEPGRGTTVRLRMPLTLAIIPALLVRSGGQSFALPQSALVELVYVPGDAIGTAIERMGSVELYRLRDRLLPLVRLDRVLELQAAATHPCRYIAVVDADGWRFGLMIDEVAAPEEIVVKPLSDALRASGVLAGATVLGDGQLAIILDLAGVAGRARLARHAPTLTDTLASALLEVA